MQSNRARLRSWIALPLAAILLLSSAPGFAQGRSEDHNQIVTAVVKDGKTVSVTRQPIPEEAFSFEAPLPKTAEEDFVPAGPREKIHPLLKEWVERRDPREKELVVVNFRDEIRIPRFPEPVTSERRSSMVNQAALAQSDRLVQEIKARRAPVHERRGRELAQGHGAEVLETFWLVDAMLLRLPLGAVKALAERADVLYIEPQHTGEEPPQASLDDVDDGRGRIASDWFFNLNQTWGWIGLLDTGVRFTHTLFNNPARIDYRRDCVNGLWNNCTSGYFTLNPTDNCWNHGTSSAGILTGNGNLGDAYRGVTAITLDSYKVYSCSGLDTAAAVRGFQAAVNALDRVIVAEIQATGDDASSISVAADNAFDAGSAVIAANGNFGPDPSTVRSPANAHKAIGVGAVDVQTLGLMNYQGRGPAPDGRIKPDIQAPTNTETASNASDTALQVFTGTSGATPYAAAAAMLFRNWLGSQGSAATPGEIYVHMILSGQRTGFDNDNGAGLVVMPNGGTFWRGSVTVGPGQFVDIPISVPANASNFNAALWWPESVSQSHNDVDLHLIDPFGSLVAYSVAIPTVFERARAAGALTPGTWTLRIYGYSVPTGSQTVYWAAHAAN